MTEVLCYGTAVIVETSAAFQQMQSPPPQ